MSKVHFVDTFVLLNLLRVPGKCQNFEQVNEEFTRLVTDDDEFVFPIATLIETGNHISHLPDGEQRRRIAQKYVELMRKAANSEDNMSIISGIDPTVLLKMLESFPDRAMMQTGFGDVSIIEQFEDYWKNRQPIGEMRIWSLDKHLLSYQKIGGLNRRKER